MNINELATLVKNNKEVLERAYTTLDSIAALSLLGAAVDKDARKYLLRGTIISLASSMALGGAILTGIGGPIVLGIEVVSTVAKAGLITGLFSIAKGLVRGFNSGIEQSKLTAKAVEDVYSLMHKHADIIKSEDISNLILTATGHFINNIEVKTN